MFDFPRNFFALTPPEITAKQDRERELVQLAIDLLEKVITPSNPECWSHLAKLGGAFVGLHVQMQDESGTVGPDGALRAVAWDVIRAFEYDLDADSVLVAQKLIASIADVAPRMPPMAD